MNQGQGFLAGTGFEHPSQQVAQQSAVQPQAVGLVNLAAPQNAPPICTGVGVPCRITVTNRYGEPREVIVYFHLPAQAPEQLKAAIETLIAMGFNIPAQRPFERGNTGGDHGQRHYNDDGNNRGNSQRQFRPQNQHGY